MELQSEHNFGMMVTARARGRTGLKVALRATDLDGGQLAGNLLELTDEIQVQVLARLQQARGSVFAGLHLQKKKKKKQSTKVCKHFLFMPQGSCTLQIYLLESPFI